VRGEHRSTNALGICRNARHCSRLPAVPRIRWNPSLSILDKVNPNTRDILFIPPKLKLIRRRRDRGAGKGEKGKEEGNNTAF
jgi:hypothetical protein